MYLGFGETLEPLILGLKIKCVSEIGPNTDRKYRKYKKLQQLYEVQAAPNKSANTQQKKKMGQSPLVHLPLLIHQHSCHIVNYGTFHGSAVYKPRESSLFCIDVAALLSDHTVRVNRQKPPLPTPQVA